MTKQTLGSEWFTNVKAGKSPSVDKFGRWRVSTPFTILDTKQLVDNLPLFYDDQEVSGSGTSSTYNANHASTTIAVSADTAGRRVRRTKLRGTYQPGKSQLINVTGVWGAPTEGITRRAGYFDDNNGLFFASTPEGMAVVRRSYVTGAVAEEIVLQDDWNIDRMDGTGPSRITLDPTKSQIGYIDFEWLGVGGVGFAFVIDNVIFPIHEMTHANKLPTVYMSTPNLPITYEIENDGTGPAASMVHICSSVASEGGQEATAIRTYISRRSTSQTLANEGLFTPVVSIRLKATHIGARITPIAASLLLTSNTNYEWIVLLNPTVAGVDAVNWQDEPNSALQFDITRSTANTVSGGQAIGGGYAASTAQAREAVTGIAASYLSIGSNIDGSLDEMVLAVANVNANGGTVYGGLLLDEYN